MLYMTGDLVTPTSPPPSTIATNIHTLLSTVVLSSSRPQVLTRRDRWWEKAGKPHTSPTNKSARTDLPQNGENDVAPLLLEHLDPVLVRPQGYSSQLLQGVTDLDPSHLRCGARVFLGRGGRDQGGTERKISMDRSAAILYTSTNFRPQRQLRDR